MSDPIITVENLGKKYRIDHQIKRQRYTTLRDVIAAGARRMVRAPFAGRKAEDSGRIEEFWALKDVSFEVERGEVVGIIGRNGAGKSTLLKILSRITEPTTGRVRIRGRVASLLEVGTGFHPELTGRENVYLNGAILGMTRAEIRRKFDEIVAFADVEKFLDTPVKRYSSGMYVRLAFAVAAHLEPEILVVDEVLAVGDVAFQKKCLGKMEDLSKEHGRTVLFVSHNMAAVKSLTRQGIVLDGGRVTFAGPIEPAVKTYLEFAGGPSSRATLARGRGAHTAIHDARLKGADGQAAARYIPGEPLRIEVEFETDGTTGMSLEVFLTDAFRSRIGMASTYQLQGQMLPLESGRYRCHLELPPMWLASGSYAIDVATSMVNLGWDHEVEMAMKFDVSSSSPLGREFDFKQSYGYGPLALLSLPEVRFAPVALYETCGSESH